MKYLLVNWAFVIISEDDEVESKKQLIKYNDPKARIIVCDSLEEASKYAPIDWDRITRILTDD